MVLVKGGRCTGRRKAPCVTYSKRKKRDRDQVDMHICKVVE